MCINHLSYRLDKTRRWNPRPSRIGRLILSALCIVASIVALPVVLTWHPDCNHYFSLIITVASFIVASFFINLLLTILTSISTCCLSNEDNNKLQVLNSVQYKVLNAVQYKVLNSV